MILLQAAASQTMSILIYILLIIGIWLAIRFILTEYSGQTEEDPLKESFQQIDELSGIYFQYPDLKNEVQDFIRYSKKLYNHYRTESIDINSGTLEELKKTVDEKCMTVIELCKQLQEKI